MSFRIGILLGVVLLIASCGFRPLYAPPTTGNSDDDVFAFEIFRKINIMRIADREGQFLRNNLTQLMHPSGRARVVEYDLNIRLSESKTDLAVRRSSDATRANLSINGDYQLYSRAAEAVIFSGSVVSTSGYNIFESEFQTLSAEKSSRERALVDLAHQIRLRIGTNFASGDFEVPESKIVK